MLSMVLDKNPDVAVEVVNLLLLIQMWVVSLSLVVSLCHYQKHTVQEFPLSRSKQMRLEYWQNCPKLTHTIPCFPFPLFFREQRSSGEFSISSNMIHFFYSVSLWSLHLIADCGRCWLKGSRLFTSNRWLINYLSPLIKTFYIWKMDSCSAKQKCKA